MIAERVMPERGAMCRSTHVAVRIQFRQHVGWEICLPTRDRRFGVVEPKAAYPIGGPFTTAMAHVQTFDTLPENPQEGLCLWGERPWAFGHGIFIGCARKFDGVAESAMTWDDVSYYNMGFTHKSHKLGCVALRGTADGFVLAYVPLDRLELQ